MAQRKRKLPQYKRQQMEDERDRAKEARLAAAAETRSQQVFLQRLDGMFQAAEEDRRANIDPADRLRIIKPFPDIFLEVKTEVLGYGECVIEELDDGHSHIMAGPLGSVRSQADAEKLIGVLADHFPEIRLRIELDDEYVVSQVIWKSFKEFFKDDATQ